MLGDAEDFVGRLWRVLPPRWFGDVAPIGSALLTGFGTAWAAIYDVIMSVRAQARLLSSSGAFVDMFAGDFFGNLLSRRLGESDAAFIQRIGFELIRPRATRSALMEALIQLTGQTPVIFEPARPADTGGYAVGGVGYGVAGGFGNLSCPYDSFVTVTRPHGAGIAALAGYDTGGVPSYGSLALVNTAVTDGDIYACVAAIVPAGYTAWVAIQG